MSKVKSLAVVLLTAATLASPVLARSSHAYQSNDTRAKVSSNVTAADGSGCVRAPRVGAFASDPWTEPPCEPNTNF